MTMLVLDALPTITDVHRVYWYKDCLVTYMYFVQSVLCIWTVYKVGLVVFNVLPWLRQMFLCVLHRISIIKGRLHVHVDMACTYVMQCLGVVSFLSISRLLLGCKLRLVLYINTQHWVHRVLRYFQYPHQCTCTCITDGCTVCNVCVCIKKFPAVVVLVRRVGCFLLFPL